MIIQTAPSTTTRKSIDHFTQLEAWQLCHKLVIRIYIVAKDFPRIELYGISDQLRRAASSMTANIAEGLGRFHYADRARFYYHSRGSCAEVQNFLLLAKDLGYLTESNFQTLYDLADRCLHVIGGLIRSTERQLKKVQ